MLREKTCGPMHGGYPSISKRDVFFVLNRILEQTTPAQIDAVHVDRIDLAVSIGRIIIDPSLHIDAGGVNRDLVSPFLHLAQPTRLLHKTEKVEELTDLALSGTAQ